MATGWATKTKLERPQVGAAEVCIASMAVLLGIVDALAPPIQTDELYYHLAIPQKILDTQGVVGGLLQPNGSRPLTLHLPFASLLSIGGDSAPRLFHLLLSVGLIVSVGQIGRHYFGRLAGLTAMLLMMGSGSVVHEFGLASNNLPTALCVLAAFQAAMAGHSRALAIAAATALSCKYSAAAPIVGVFIVAKLPWRTRVMTGLVALALVSPWWLRNLIDGLHPLFPYMGWPAIEGEQATENMQFFFLEKYGAGRDANAMFWLPWNAVMTSSFYELGFLGRLNPALLALAPLTLLRLRETAHRRIVIASLVAYLGWLAGAHWMRHLLPALPLLALACGSGLHGIAGTSKSPRIIILLSAWTVGIAGIAANLGPLSTRIGSRAYAAMGCDFATSLKSLPKCESDSSLEYMRDNHRGYAAIEYVNKQLPPDAKVALLFQADTYLIQRSTLLGGVEDHIPVRYFLFQHQENSLSVLRDLGATHIMISKTRFLRKEYPFLSDAQFESDFQAPMLLLEDRLKMEATKIFEAKPTTIYRLDEPQKQTYSDKVSEEVP